MDAESSEYEIEDFSYLETLEADCEESYQHAYKRWKDHIFEVQLAAYEPLPEAEDRWKRMIKDLTKAGGL